MATTQPLPSLDQMQDILDIEGLIRFPWDRLFHWALVVLLVTFLVVLAFVFYRCWQRRKNILNSDEHLLPHERFLLEVKRLRQQKLLAKGEFRKYYFFLSETFRRYLWEQFDYPATDKTTPEIVPDLAGIFSGVSGGPQMAANFLRRADLVKFANYIPSAKEGDVDTDELLSLVADVAKGNEQPREAS